MARIIAAIAAALVLLAALPPLAEAQTNGRTVSEGPPVDCNDGVLKVAAATVNDTFAGSGRCLFEAQGDVSYTFSLPTPPYNYSANVSANDSISASVEASWESVSTPELRLSDYTEFHITFDYNSGEQTKFSYYYSKAKSAIFWTKWTGRYEIWHNGELKCESERELHIGGTIETYPQARVALTFNNPVNVTSSPTSDYQVDAALWRMYDGEYGVFLECIPEGSEFAGVNSTALTAPMSVTMQTTYQNEIEHQIAYGFWPLEVVPVHMGNFVAAMQALGSAVGDIVENHLFCTDNFWEFIGCSMKTFLEGAITTVFGLLNRMLDFIFGWLPGGQTFVDLILLPLDMTVKLFVAMLQFYFGTGEGYGPGGIYFSHLVWSAAFGAGISMYNSDLSLIWRMPFWFIKLTTIGVAMAFYFIYYQFPKTAIEIAVNIVRVIRG